MRDHIGDRHSEDGIFKRCGGENFENISILIAVGVSSDGRREILGQPKDNRK